MSVRPPHLRFWNCLLPRSAYRGLLWAALAGLLLWTGPAGTAKARQAAAVTVTAPRPGEALQGVVAVSGTTAVEGFRSAEIAFAYPADPTGTWFLIQQNPGPVTEGPLAQWDTSTISDGVYRLRVQVITQSGTVLEAVVDDLRVRNYTPVETAPPGSPAGGTPQLSPAAATATPPGDFQPRVGTAEAAPTNPAQVSIPALRASAGQGVLVVLGGLLAAGAYLGLKALTRR